MTETPSTGVKTLAIRLPDELHAQLVLVAQLDGVSLAEAIRQAVEIAITRRRDDGDLAVQAQRALEQFDQDARARRAALEALVGPGPKVKVGFAPADKPAAKPRGGASTA